MSYEITKSDGTPISIADAAIDTTQFTIGLVGKNVSGYGAEIAKTQIHLLEHFANSTAPANPTAGQLWWDKANTAMKVYDGATFIELSTGGGDTDPFIPDGDILPNTDCVGGEIGQNIGSPSLQFCHVYANTFNGVATSAKYADMAERYEADKLYIPGTVVKIGGEKEITETTSSFDTNVFGVISQKPGFMLNSEAGPDTTHPFVALAGRVKVRVTGQVKKGDRLVSSNEPGVAMNGDVINVFSVIGRALEDKDTDGFGEILVVVGAH